MTFCEGWDSASVFLVSQEECPLSNKYPGAQGFQYHECTWNARETALSGFCNPRACGIGKRLIPFIQQHSEILQLERSPKAQSQNLKAKCLPMYVPISRLYDHWGRCGCWHYCGRDGGHVLPASLIPLGRTTREVAFLTSSSSEVDPQGKDFHAPKGDQGDWNRWAIRYMTVKVMPKMKLILQPGDWRGALITRQLKPVPKSSDDIVEVWEAA
jgi:hypothetical protein